MLTVTSKDDTRIAYQTWGKGEPLILVDGATMHRALDPDWTNLPNALTGHFLVVRYNRRGRGESGDTRPYEVQREIEDLEAAIDTVGGHAFVFGRSSGGALALESASALHEKITWLAVYEVPYQDDAEAAETWQRYRNDLTAALQAGRHGDAVTLFMQTVGLPPEMIAGMKHSLMWPALEAVAPTLALGAHRRIPTDRLSQLEQNVLILHGDSSFPFMVETASALTAALPHAQHQTLPVQTHSPEATVLAPLSSSFSRLKPRSSGERSLGKYAPEAIALMLLRS